MAKKRIKLENVIGKNRTSMFGSNGLYKLENGTIKPVKLEESKEIIFEIKELR